MEHQPFDTEEKELMELTETGEYRVLSKEEQTKVTDAIHAGKDKTISLRLNSKDLEDLKTRAESVGMPYQTLISTILHRYISGGVLLKDPI